MKFKNWRAVNYYAHIRFNQQHPSAIINIRLNEYKVTNPRRIVSKFYLLVFYGRLLASWVGSRYREAMILTQLDESFRMVETRS